MPRIPEDPPDVVVIERDGLEFRVGKGGALSFDELEALRHQHEKRALFAGERPSWPISRTLLERLLAVKRVFPGATIEDWRAPHERTEAKPWERWRAA